MRIHARPFISFPAALLLLAATAFAADAPMKIGYVDLDRVTEKSAFVRDLMGDLEKALNDKRAELETKQQNYTNLRAEIERRRSVLKESEIEAKMQESRRLRGEIEQLDYEINRMFRNAEKKQMGPALDQILKTIREIGAAEGYDVILRGEVVLYGKPSTDVSDLVAERLNRDYASGKIRIDGLKEAAEKSQKAEVPEKNAEPKRSDKARRPAVSDDEARAEAAKKK